MDIINGKELAEKIKDNIVKEILKIKSRRPSLAIILIGEREDSKLYVSLKEQEAGKVGIDTSLYRCPENITESEVFEMIRFLNEDDSIDAILIQLPLPSGFDTDGIILAIDPAKDVDGFHPDNIQSIFAGEKFIMPPVCGVVLEMLESIKYELSGKNVCVLANSDIFGRTLAKIIASKGASCELANPDSEFVSKTKEADVLISAIGRPHFVKKEMIKQDAILIDVGITKTSEGVKGDIDFMDVDGKASFITPVPGGVGPMTIAMAFRNTLELYRKNKK